MSSEKQKQFNLAVLIVATFFVDLITKYWAWKSLVVPLTGLKPLSLFETFVIGIFFQLFTITGKEFFKQDIDYTIRIYQSSFLSYGIYILLIISLSFFI